MAIDKKLIKRVSEDEKYKKYGLLFHRKVNYL